VRAGSVAAGIIVALVLAVPAHAKTWQKTITTSYTLSASDSLEMARHVIESRLRMLAAGQAGHYVQGRETLVNNHYSSRIRVDVAAVVRLKNIREKRSLDPTGRMKLTMTALAIVDEAELKHRIAAIQRGSASGCSVKREQTRCSDNHNSYDSLADNPGSWNRKFEQDWNDFELSM